MLIKISKIDKNVITPTKRDEDMGYDIYSYFHDNYMILKPHKVTMIPTGIYSSFSKNYGIILKERGSTGTKNIGQRCGVIDSGYRDEWFVPLSNHNFNIVILYKDSKDKDEDMKIKENILKGINKNIFKRLYNSIFKPIFYPCSKAISQAIIINSIESNIQEITSMELMNIDSERGKGKLGDSGK